MRRPPRFFDSLRFARTNDVTKGSTLTKSMIDLPELIAKSEDGDFLRDLIRDAAERLMDVEVSALCGAGHGQRTPLRENQRNGYRGRRWDTRAGSISLNIPKLRKGPYFPAFLEPRRTAEKAVELTAEQAAFLEKMNPCFRERHVESGAPGELLSADTFFVGTLKGVGKVYLHAVVDTYGSYAFGFLHVSKQPEAAVAVLRG